MCVGARNLVGPICGHRRPPFGKKTTKRQVTWKRDHLLRKPPFVTLKRDPRCVRITFAHGKGPAPPMYDAHHKKQEVRGHFEHTLGLFLVRMCSFKARHPSSGPVRILPGVFFFSFFFFSSLLIGVCFQENPHF